MENLYYIFDEPYEWLDPEPIIVYSYYFFEEEDSLELSK